MKQLKYIFGMPLIDNEDSTKMYNENEVKLSAFMLKYWTNFITTGYLNNSCDYNLPNNDLIF